MPRHPPVAKCIRKKKEKTYNKPITGEGRWPVEPPFVAPPEEEDGASLGSALVTVAGSLAISFAVHVGCSVGYWALKRGWAWRVIW